MNRTAESIAPERKRVVHRFLLNAHRLQVEVLEQVGEYRLWVRDLANEEEPAVLALVLPCTADYYVFHLQQHQVPLLIVQKHNMVVPVPVLCLRDVKRYLPLEEPEQTPQVRKRRSHDEVLLLVSKLIQNFQSAYQELEAMHPRNQQRYLQLVDVYTMTKPGRPWKV